MQIESKQPHSKANLQRGRLHTSLLRGKQILGRRREIDPIRKRPHTIVFGELRGKSASNGAGRGGDASELSNVLELVSDAWNYFPHKILGGISPADLSAEASA